MLDATHAFLILRLALAKHRKLPELQRALKTRGFVRSVMTCGSEDDLYRIGKDHIYNGLGEVVFTQAVGTAKRLLEEYAKLGIALHVPGTPHYPNKLLSIDKPPILLFTKGDAALLNEAGMVAVVGSRAATETGLAFSAALAQEVVQAGRAVVSGLALGCDTAAHAATQRAGGKTIAVLAHGLDQVYPSSNTALANDIVKSGGCLVSEYLPGVAPSAHQFVERNRIQSALSEVVAIVEAGASSGTMHTANACIAQHRVLACMVPMTSAPVSNVAGNKIILGKGAARLDKAADIHAVMARASAGEVRSPLSEAFKRGSSGVFSGGSSGGAGAGAGAGAGSSSDAANAGKKSKPLSEEDRKLIAENRLAALKRRLDALRAQKAEVSTVAAVEAKIAAAEAALAKYESAPAVAPGAVPARLL